MNSRTLVFTLFFLLPYFHAAAQKPFTEGVIVYKVSMQPADQKEIGGLYTFTIKGDEIKKELKLNNGYQDVVLINCSTGNVYSLENKYGRKYAIQLAMEELVKKQEQFAGYTVNNEEESGKKFAGVMAAKGNISYKNGSTAEVYYTKEWCPSQAVTYERFPSSKFLPLYFTYKDESGLSMTFEAEKIEAHPVENAVFRIPADYKMISYKEYKELSK